MLVSAGVELLTGGDEGALLLGVGLLVAIPGAALWRFTHPPPRMGHASIFSAVLSAWAFLSVAGALPYLATGSVTSVSDALFESVSGFTTTGATILRPIEVVGDGVLFWRALTQWMGGMGVIVLAVAVLPYLGIGGLGLLRAESPGPTSERLVPRIRETAQRLWILYLALTALVAAAYLVAGMDAYDAVAHAFTTASTGGFSPYDDSLRHFRSAAVEWIAITGMFLAGGSFALYWRALRGKPLLILRSPEAGAYVGIVVAMSAVTTAWNAATNGLGHDVIRSSVFTVVSLSSTTGYTTADYTAWASPVQLVLLFGMVVGGMTGSTAGGFKVFRLLAVLSYGRRQAMLQLHPRIVKVVRIGDQVIPEAIVYRVVGFFGLFMATGAAGTFVVAAFGGDILTSISSTAASIGNVGPGLGRVGPGGDFLNIAWPARVGLAVVMLIGRLEVFPVLLGLVPLARVFSDRLPRRMRRLVVRLGRG